MFHLYQYLSLPHSHLCFIPAIELQNLHVRYVLMLSFSQVILILQFVPA